MKLKIRKFLKELKKEIYYFNSKQSPILFNHLPKCGGTTINLYLTKQYPKRLVFGLIGSNPQKSVNEFINLSQKKRWNFKLVSGHMAHKLQEYTHPDTFSITVFREPVDRIISHYYYVKRNKNHYLHEKVEKENILLEAYCTLNLSDEVSNYYVINFSGLSKEEVEKNPDSSIELALKNILKMNDLIGFQEDIPIFVKALKDKFSFKAPQSVAQINRTNNRKQIKDLAQDTIDKISQSNSLDIQLYSKLFALKKNGIIQSNKF